MTKLGAAVHPLATSISSIRRVVVPLDATGDSEDLLLPATVLANWFGARLQLLTSETGLVDHYTTVAAGLGVPVAPVETVDRNDFAVEVAQRVAADPPSILVTRADADGVRLATANPQASFLMATGPSHRLSTGPLVLPVVGRTSDLDALLLTAAWAGALDLQVCLVAEAPAATDAPNELVVEHLAVATQRLQEMGVEVAEASLCGDGSDSALSMASDRTATALVIAADRLGDPTIVATADAAGVAVLVAPPRTTNTGSAIEVERRGLAPLPSALTLAADDVQALDADECAVLLEQETVGRIGFIEEGWPVIAPVTYAAGGDGIVVRSTAGFDLQPARHRATVCLEIDRPSRESPNDGSANGWTVLVYGSLEAIGDPQALRTAWETASSPITDGEPWLRLRVRSMVGRRVS